MQRDLKRLRIITMDKATTAMRIFKDDDAGMLQCEMQHLARLKFDPRIKNDHFLEPRPREEIWAGH
jgi:hypothetical protein